jgi:NADH-quinone oxidoreductase subunit H
MTFVVFATAAFVVVNVMALVGGLATYAERKISADIQLRQGPNRVGPYGILQFLADGVKMIMKEDVFPADADKPLFNLAPLLALLGVFATLALVPFSSGFTLVNLNMGVFFLIGVSSLVGVAVFLGGYSSNSKWSMLGGMRGASQIISYEVPVTITTLMIVLLSGGMSFGSFVETQGGLPHQWYLLHNPFTFIGFFVFFVGMLAETNRAPFDLPEAESELVSGYHTEYTGMRFGLFALAEYIEVFVLCGVGVAAFLGGYKVPFDLGSGVLFVQKFGLPPIIGKNIGQLLQLGSFLTKTFALYYLVIWVRWTFPRIRVDQVMTICWKYLTPIALFNLVGVAVWMYASDNQSIWQLLGHAFSGGHGGGH